MGVGMHLAHRKLTHQGVYPKHLWCDHSLNTKGFSGEGAVKRMSPPHPQFGVLQSGILLARDGIWFCKVQRLDDPCWYTKLPNLPAVSDRSIQSILDLGTVGIERNLKQVLTVPLCTHSLNSCSCYHASQTGLPATQRCEPLWPYEPMFGGDVPRSKDFGLKGPKVIYRSRAGVRIVLLIQMLHYSEEDHNNLLSQQAYYA